VYVFGQLPLTLALATVGAGLELAVVQSGEGEVPTGTRLVLAGGVVVYLLSVSFTEVGMSKKGARRGLWWPVVAAAVAAADILLELPAAVVVGALAAVVVAVVVVGLVERATGRVAVEEV
jgi:low temperature requirement protein LtrA